MGTVSTNKLDEIDSQGDEKKVHNLRGSVWFDLKKKKEVDKSLRAHPIYQFSYY